MTYPKDNEIFTLTLTGEEKSDDLIRAGKYDYQYINTDYAFPPPEKGIVEIELVRLGYRSSSQMVVNDLDQRGYRMATFMEVLDLVAQNPELIDRKYIVSISDDWYISCGRSCGGRNVRVSRFGGSWDDCWWFAGVKTGYMNGNGELLMTKKVKPKPKYLRAHAIIFQDEHGQVIHTFADKKQADEFYKKISK